MTKVTKRVHYTPIDLKDIKNRLEWGDVQLIADELSTTKQHVVEVLSGNRGYTITNKQTKAYKIAEMAEMVVENRTAVMLGLMIRDAMRLYDCTPDQLNVMEGVIWNPENLLLKLAS